LAEPILAWAFEETDDILLNLLNIVSPAAMRKRAKVAVVDPGKPLGKGLASKQRIIGGEIIYEDHQSDHPLLKTEFINGLRLPVTGGSVRRTEDGRIVGHVDVAKVAPLMRELNDTMGIADGYDFFSATEYLSEDPQHPSIFQNLVQSTTQRPVRRTKAKLERSGLDLFQLQASPFFPVFSKRSESSFRLSWWN
jgi:hypothetical protein